MEEILILIIVPTCKFDTEENSKFGVCYTSIFNNPKFIIIQFSQKILKILRKLLVLKKWC